VKIKSIVLAAIISTLILSAVFSQQQVVKNDYRIEETIGKDSKGRDSRVIRFISPSGKVIKKVSNALNRQGYVYSVSPMADYAIKIDEIEEKTNGAAKVRLTLIDANAKTAWVKTLDVDYVSKSEDEPMSYFLIISDDGDRIVFTRIRGYNDHPDSAYHEIIVYDTIGAELARVGHIPQILDGYQISIAPDGKLVAATLHGGKLFFLDVKTGSYKICMSRGIIDGRKWSASYDFTVQINDKKAIDKAVWISAGIRGDWRKPNDKVPHWSGMISFSDIPDDLSTLFNK